VSTLWRACAFASNQKSEIATCPAQFLSVRDSKYFYPLSKTRAQMRPNAGLGASLVVDIVLAASGLPRPQPKGLKGRYIPAKEKRVHMRRPELKPIDPRVP
jgi:hypothetical protein